MATEMTKKGEHLTFGALKKAKVRSRSGFASGYAVFPC